LLGDAEIAAVAEVIRSGETLSAGQWRDRFEQAFAAHLGVPHVASVGSGSAALRLALQLLDLRPGDEVIATPQTYKSSIQSLLDTGVSVRFCDIDPDSLNIDPARIPELITDHTKAIVLVDYGGFPADLPAVLGVAREHGLKVVEDAAHGIGGSTAGRPIGALADYACFSFHTSKNISTLGEGGLVVLPDAEARARAVKLRRCRVDAVTTPARHHFGGRDAPPPISLYPEDSYTTDETELLNTGTNSTLSEPAAAVGLVQLGRLPEFQARRRQLTAYYTEQLGGLPGVTVPVVPAGSEHAWHYFTFFVDPARTDRDEVLRRCLAEGIRLDLRYFPLHLMPEWRARGHRAGECPIAEDRFFTAQINLPCSPSLTDADAELLMAVVRDAVTAARPALAS
jgi:perosamine synthetase